MNILTLLKHKRERVLLCIFILVSLGMILLYMPTPTHAGMFSGQRYSGYLSIKSTSAPNSYLTIRTSATTNSYLSLALGYILELWYQPTTIISGVTLPDRATVTDNPGTISWGTSAGVASLSPLIPYATPLEEIEQPAQDVAPEVGLSLPYDPITGGSPTVPANPVSPLVEGFFAFMWGTSFGITWMIIAFISTIALFILSLKLFAGHVGGAGAVACVALGIFAKIGAVPPVLMYVAVFGLILSAVTEWKERR